MNPCSSFNAIYHWLLTGEYTPPPSRDRDSHMQRLLRDAVELDRSAHLDAWLRHTFVTIIPAQMPHHGFMARLVHDLAKEALAFGDTPLQAATYLYENYRHDFAPSVPHPDALVADAIAQH